MFNVQLITGQNNKEDTYYLSNELNFGNYFGIDYNLNYVLKNKYSLKIGFSGNVRKPKSQPENYSGGLSGLFSLGIENPYDHLLNYRIDFGKIYNLNPKGTIRMNFSFGIGYSIIKEPNNWQFVETDAVINLAENYTYSYRSYSTLSFIINPKIEIPFTRFYGLTISPMIQINKDRTYFGIGIGQMIGLLRKKKNSITDYEKL